MLRDCTGLPGDGQDGELLLQHSIKEMMDLQCPVTFFKKNSLLNVSQNSRVTRDSTGGHLASAMEGRHFKHLQKIHHCQERGSAACCSVSGRHPHLSDSAFPNSGPAGLFLRLRWHCLERIPAEESNCYQQGRLFLCFPLSAVTS